MSVHRYNRARQEWEILKTAANNILRNTREKLEEIPEKLEEIAEKVSDAYNTTIAICSDLLKSIQPRQARPTSPLPYQREEDDVVIVELETDNF